MIFDINEENLNLLASTACPVDLPAHGDCMLLDDELYSESSVAICRACWVKWLSEGSDEDYFLCLSN